MAITPLQTSLSTIASPALSEFVLELGSPPSGFALVLWGNWDEIDKLLNGFLDRYPDFKLVIRTGELYNREGFKAQVREIFPLMAGRDGIQFETWAITVDEHWGKCCPPCSVPTILRIHELTRLFNLPPSRAWEVPNTVNIHGYIMLPGKGWCSVQIAENGECDR